jgi:hypothetical protein
MYRLTLQMSSPTDVKPPEDAAAMTFSSATSAPNRGENWTVWNEKSTPVQIAV